MSNTIVSLLAEGDSLTYAVAGYVNRAFSVPAGWLNLDTDRYMTRFLRTSSNPTVIGHTIGVSGSTLLGAMTTRLSSRLPALIGQKSNSAGTRKFLLTILAGTNTDTTNPNTHAANMATYVASAKALGIDKVLVGTLPSRTDATATAQNFDTVYQAPYNTIIRDSAWQIANNVDGIIDFAADTEIGAIGASNNATYFLDHVHPTTAGFTLMTARYLTAVNTVLATMV